ncbi:MAG: flavoprotein [Parcubacteria group bacterium]|nr:flavoprotein [Parcubacteria group bacterium]
MTTQSARTPSDAKEKKVWDVAVIGGGAAGMMAAGVAAAAGASVVLLEKNPGLGKKLLITGGGRCNVTNAEFDTRVLLAKFNSRGKKTDQFLFSPFAKHGVEETLAFFNDRGMPTKIEANKRVFPESNSAQSVWDVLNTYIEEGRVKVIPGIKVLNIAQKDGHISYVELANQQRVLAHSYIFATGGKSRPETGSTGDGFDWLRVLGHEVKEPDASLVPLTLKDSWTKALAGVSLPSIALTMLQNNKKYGKRTGGMVFTHQGISGPAVLNSSNDVGELLKYGPVSLSLDLLPGIALDALDVQLRASFEEDSNKKVRNVVSKIIPASLADVVFEKLEMNGDMPCHTVNRAQRIALGHTIKGIEMNVHGLLGVEKAIVTSGGVVLTEIDFRSMRSKLIDNLFVVGDLLNIDRPSGGYSLQLCWTTGTVAGLSAAEAAKAHKTH